MGDQSAAGGSERVRESSLMWPMLTRSNYAEWAMLLQCNFETLEIWDTIEPGGADVKRSRDRQAMAGILRSVPQEMWQLLGAKKNVKEAWQAVKSMRVGADRVKEANAQRLLKEFENIAFRDSETVDEFALRIGALAADLRTAGETMEDARVVKKMLRVLPQRYSQIAVSIETLLDLKTMTIEELVGRLKMAEDRFGIELITDKADKLLLTEEEWVSKNRYRLMPESSSAGSGEKKSWRKNGGGSSRGDRGNKKDAVPKLTSEGTPRRKGRCRNCGIYGHWKEDCKKPPRRERKEEAHVATADNESPSLLLATASVIHVLKAPSVACVSAARETDVVHLNERKVYPRDQDEDQDIWVLDTGASNHMTGRRDALSSLDTSVRGTVKFGDGSLVNIEGIGSVVLQTKKEGHKVLTDVYYIPKLRSNIVSLGQLEEGGCKVVLEDGFCKVYDAERLLLARAPRVKNRLYLLNLHLAAPVCLISKADDLAWLWHGRYGHLNFRALKELGAKSMVDGLPLIDRVDEVCDSCALGKHQRHVFPQVASYRAESGLELVHADLCGQIRPQTPGGKSYFLLIVDDHSRYMWVELLKTKDEAFKCFKRVRALAETEHGAKLRAFRSDRGGEFNSLEFKEYCDEHGIKHFTTAPYTPQQNGVVERRNCTVVEMARCLLKARGVPAEFWGEAVSTAVYLLNRSPTKSLKGKTPYEAWHNRKPKVHHLRTFRCVVYVKKVGPGLTKLADRSTKMVFVGYEAGTKGYRVYDPVAKKLHISRDVIFEEGRAWDWNHQDRLDSAVSEFDVEHYTVVGRATVTEADAVEGAAAVSGEQGQNSPVHDQWTIDTDTQEGLSPATPQGAPANVEFATPQTGESHDSEGVPLRFRTLDNIFDTTEQVHDFEFSGVCLHAAEEPRSVSEALEEQCWRRAMMTEMSSIESNKTWELSVLPAGHKAIGLKWVFKVKKDPDGNIIKHKARLVAKGYAQREGVDFEEVFAPVARIETVRLIIALAAQRGWQVHHMDVKSAFLNGDLLEEVYVQQPPGFVVRGDGSKVLKLNKALYGLRQAPRAWNARLDRELLKLGFQRNPLEHAVYRRAQSKGNLLVGVYVDDLIITGPSQADIDAFKKEMMGSFSMSDLGLLSYYLGIQVIQKDGEIMLCQSAYALKILEQAGMKGCNPCHVPMENRLRLSKNDKSPPVDKTKYRSVVGSLRYLVNTRPDIAYAVGIVSRYMEDPRGSHWAAVKQILRYISGTVNFGCRYKKLEVSENLITGYSDSNLAGDIDDRKSTSSSVFLLGNSLVTWLSQKQRVVALSSCEAEYIASANAACQGIWLNRLLGEILGIPTPRVKLLVDNMSAIALSKNPVHHDRSKHIDVQYHFIRDCVDKGEVDIVHVGTNDQLADILTKPLGRVKFVEQRQSLGVVQVQRD
jgi:transposase InsO family protein